MGQATSELSGNDPNLPRVPRDIKFRVLIIGRANAGKTTILQKVCETTESPEIYRRDQEGHRQRVRSRPQ
jgi:GTP-binding protein EngB required for normal cell division